MSRALRPWSRLKNGDYLRRGPRGVEIARVYPMSPTRFEWWVEGVGAGDAPTLEGAQIRADAALARAGWDVSP